jgi:L,D-transpeptidase ErfK/SrfK
MDCRHSTIAIVFLLTWSSLAGAVQRESHVENPLLREYGDLMRRLQEMDLPTPYLVVNTHENQLLLKSGERVLRNAVCSTGSGRRLEGPKRWKHKWHFETPKGSFSVLRKVENPIWTKPEWAFLEAGEEIPIFAEDKRRFEFGALGSYALYFAKEYMIHGTIYEINLGKSITHGCVRIGESDLEYFYDTVEAGWPVFIY